MKKLNFEVVSLAAIAAVSISWDINAAKAAVISAALVVTIMTQAFKN